MRIQHPNFINEIIVESYSFEPSRECRTDEIIEGQFEVIITDPFGDRFGFLIEGIPIDDVEDFIQSELDKLEVTE